MEKGPSLCLQQSCGPVDCGVCCLHPCSGGICCEGLVSPALSAHVRQEALGTRAQCLHLTEVTVQLSVTAFPERSNGVT